MTVKLPLCSKCGEHPRAGKSCWCKECLSAQQRKRYAENPEERERRRRNRTTDDRASAKRQRDKLKKEIFDHYGRECVCCGEDHCEFLTIDHINGRPEHHKGKGGFQLYKLIKAEGFPDIYRVLCWNCNASRGLYGYCPHETTTEGG